MSKEFAGQGFADSDTPPPPPAKGGLEGWLAIGVLVLAAVIVAFLFGIFDRPAQRGTGASHPAVGKKFGPVDLKPLEPGDAPFTQEDLQGKITLINFWGPWCKPCLDEFPKLVHIVDHHREDEEFQMIFVSCSSTGNEQSPDHLSDTRELLAARGYDIRVFTDPMHNTISGVQKVTMTNDFFFPTTIMVNPDGKIAAMWVGYETYFVDEMDAMVHQALDALAAKKN